jgi:hypothetical protein
MPAPSQKMEKNFRKSIQVLLFLVNTLLFVGLLLLFAIAFHVDSAEGAAELFYYFSFLPPAYFAGSLAGGLWWVSMKPERSTIYGISHLVLATMVSLIFSLSIMDF